MGRERNLVRHLYHHQVERLPYRCGTMAYMTKLFEQAIAQVCELPEDQQDAVATNLINLIEDRLTADEERELTESRQEYERGDFRPYLGSRSTITI